MEEEGGEEDECLWSMMQAAAGGREVRETTC